MEVHRTEIKQEDTLLFEEVYEKYYKQIMAYFVKRIGNKSDAEDLTSEVFLYCYKNLNTFDSKKSSISTWIYLIAKSRYYNYCRDKRLTECIDDYEHLVGDSADLMDKAIYLDELRTQLNEALKCLTERQKNIIILRYFEDKSSEEIADLFCTSSNNIRVQLHKALKKLKKIMES